MLDFLIELKENFRLADMDDEVVQRVFQEGGRDYFQQQPSTSSSSSSILQSLPLHVVCFLCLYIHLYAFIWFSYLFWRILFWLDMLKLSSLLIMNFWVCEEQVFVWPNWTLLCFGCFFFPVDFILKFVVFGLQDFSLFCMWIVKTALPLV